MQVESTLRDDLQLTMQIKFILYENYVTWPAMVLTTNQHIYTFYYHSIYVKITWTKTCDSNRLKNTYPRRPINQWIELRSQIQMADERFKGFSNLIVKRKKFARSARKKVHKTMHWNEKILSLGTRYNASFSRLISYLRVSLGAKKFWGICGAHLSEAHQTSHPLLADEMWNWLWGVICFDAKWGVK